MPNTHRQQIFLRINTYLLLFAAATFCANQQIFLPIAIVWLLLALIEWNWKERYQLLKENRLLPLALCFIALYACYLLSPLLSDNIRRALSDWEYKVWLLVTPVCIMPLIPRLSPKTISLTMIVFAIPLLLWAIACMGYSTFQYVHTGKLWYFFYDRANFPEFPPSFSHPSYFSLYENVAWFISVLFLLRRNEWLKYRIVAILLWGCLLILPLHLFLLQSKMGLMLFGLTLLVIIPYSLNYRKRQYGLTAIVIAALMACGAFYLYRAHSHPHDEHNNRVANMFTRLKSADHEDPRESSSIRIALWSNALEIGKEHWFCGIGTGDVGDEMREKAAEHHYKFIASGRFNCHNQYLQVWLGLGIIGLILFVSIFAISFVNCLRKRSIIGALTIALFALNLMVECMWERYSGATLIPIATAILYSISPATLSSEKSESHNHEALPSTSCA